MGNSRAIWLVILTLSSGLAGCAAQTEENVLGKWVVSEIAAEGYVSALSQQQVSAMIGKTIEVTALTVIFEHVRYPISRIVIGTDNQQPSFQSDINSQDIYVRDKNVFRPDVRLLPIRFGRASADSTPRWFFDELMYVNTDTLLLARGGVYFLVKRGPN